MKGHRLMLAKLPSKRHNWHNNWVIVNRYKPTFAAHQFYLLIWSLIDINFLRYDPTHRTFLSDWP